MKGMFEERKNPALPRLEAPSEKSQRFKSERQVCQIVADLWASS